MENLKVPDQNCKCNCKRTVSIQVIIKARIKTELLRLETEFFYNLVTTQGNLYIWFFLTSLHFHPKYDI